MRSPGSRPNIDGMDDNIGSRLPLAAFFWAAVGAGIADVVIASLDVLGARGVVDSLQPTSVGYVEQAVVVLGDVCFLLAWQGIGGAYAANGWARAGRWAVRLALAAGSLILVANTVTLVAWRQQLVALHMLGFLLWLAGSVVLVVAGWHRAVLPRWLLAALAICPIVVWAGPVGQYTYGAVWVLVGAALLQGYRRRIGRHATLTPTV
jgi:hypothetical protein